MGGHGVFWENYIYKVWIIYISAPEARDFYYYFTVARRRRENFTDSALPQVNFATEIHPILLWGGGSWGVLRNYIYNRRFHLILYI